MHNLRKYHLQQKVETVQEEPCIVVGFVENDVPNIENHPLFKNIFYSGDNPNEENWYIIQYEEDNSIGLWCENDLYETN